MTFVYGNYCRHRSTSNLHPRLQKFITGSFHQVVDAQFILHPKLIRATLLKSFPASTQLDLLMAKSKIDHTLFLSNLSFKYKRPFTKSLACSGVMVLSKRNFSSTPSSNSFAMSQCICFRFGNCCSGTHDVS